MVMANNICISEILCFLINKFGKCPIKCIKDVVLKFYDADEVVRAKEVLYGELVKLNTEGLPNRLTKRQGDNRMIRDVDDLFTYITKADEAGMLTLLPSFVAANLDRIPSVKPEELNLCLLLQKVTKLEAIVSQHDDVIRCVGGQRGSSTDGSLVPLITGDCAGNDQPVVPTDMTEDIPPVLVNESWAALASHLAQDPPDGWSPAPARHKKKTRSTVPIRVRGSKDVSSSAVRAVPRRDVLAAFVGRIHPETTEKDLTVYLEQEGMKGVICRKLKPKDGRTYRTAAFYVTCCKESVNLFYDEQCWPEGAELRDWVYK